MSKSSRGRDEKTKKVVEENVEKETTSLDLWREKSEDVGGVFSPVVWASKKGTHGKKAECGVSEKAGVDGKKRPWTKRAGGPMIDKKERRWREEKVGWGSRGERRRRRPYPFVHWSLVLCCSLLEDFPKKEQGQTSTCTHMHASPVQPGSRDAIGIVCVLDRPCRADQTLVTPI